MQGDQNFFFFFFGFFCGCLGGDRMGSTDRGTDRHRTQCQCKESAACGGISGRGKLFSHFFTEISGNIFQCFLVLFWSVFWIFAWQKTHTQSKRKTFLFRTRLWSLKWICPDKTEAFAFLVRFLTHTKKHCSPGPNKLFCNKTVNLQNQFVMTRQKYLLFVLESNVTHINKEIRKSKGSNLWRTFEIKQTLRTVTLSLNDSSLFLQGTCTVPAFPVLILIYCSPQKSGKQRGRNTFSFLLNFVTEMLLFACFPFNIFVHHFWENNFLRDWKKYLVGTNTHAHTYTPLPHVFPVSVNHTHQSEGTHTQQLHSSFSMLKGTAAQHAGTLAPKAKHFKPQIAMADSHQTHISHKVSGNTGHVNTNLFGQFGLNANSGLVGHPFGQKTSQCCFFLFSVYLLWAYMGDRSWHQRGIHHLNVTEISRTNESGRNSVVSCSSMQFFLLNYWLSFSIVLHLGFPAKN